MSDGNSIEILEFLLKICFNVPLKYAMKSGRSISYVLYGLSLPRNGATENSPLINNLIEKLFSNVG